MSSRPARRVSRFAAAALPIFLWACSTTPAVHRATPPQLTDHGAEAHGSLRLDDSVRPLSAELSFDIDPRQAEFSGETRIELDVGRPTRTLRVNATELQIGAVDLSVAAETQPGTVARIDEDTIELVFPRAIEPGRATVRIAFRGTLDGTRSQGLYRVQEPDGRWYAYTFFEPIDARRAFPGFDQPDAKIPWTIAIRTRGDDVAAANTATANVETHADGRTYRFESTRPLPSYLVAFVVGPFDVVEGGHAGAAKLPIRFIVPQGHRSELRYALETTPRVVDALESFFGTPFPYPKLDVAVVPRFWGTMEHPGIVAMGQPLTLIEPHEETPGRHQGYTNILIHELAHYWFGDLVTMQWWDDIWLNESLALWADTRVTADFEPSWKWNLRWGGSAASAMESDARRDPSPLQRRIVSRSDIGASFENSITYSKGASILRMFEQAIGTERFHEGLRTYFARHADRSVDADDFLAALASVATPAQIDSLRTFIVQPGVPLVRARLDCDASGARLNLRQERFFAEGPGRKSDALWTFPLCARYGAGDRESRSCTWMSEREATLALDADAGCPDWLIANADAAGYFRVDYAGGTSPQLFAQPAINALERRMLAADAGALAAAGYGDVRAALALIPVLAGADDPTLPRAALRLINGLIRRDQLSPALRVELEALIGRTIAPTARRLGLAPNPEDSQETRDLRSAALWFAGAVGHDPDVRTHAMDAARAWLKDRKSVDADLVGTVLGIAASTDDAGLIDAMFVEARQTEDRDDRERLYFALGRSSVPATRERALAVTLDANVDLRESSSALQGALYSQESVASGFHFLRDHYDALIPRLRDDEKSWLIGAIGTACDMTLHDEAKAFLDERVKAFDGGSLALSKALESIATCSAQWQRNGAGVAEFLQSHGKSDAAFSGL